MRSRSRYRAVTGPRGIVMFLAMELAGASLSKIGRHFDRDHTTVLSNVRHVGWLVETSPKVAAYVEECRQAVRPSVCLRRRLVPVDNFSTSLSA